MTTLEQELAAHPKPYPIWHRTLITREAGVRLTALLRDGMKVPANVGKSVLVTFKQAGDFMMEANTGWKQVRLRSNFGGTSVLLYEEDKGRIVSGLLRLKR